jgi:DNA-binding PadR family transcriptional regulator
MVKILDANLVQQHFIITHEGKRVELIKEHFVITDDGQHALLDLGNPYVINDDNKNSIPNGETYLQDVRRNIDPTISEIRGLEYFAQRQVLFDYKKAVIMVADHGDEISLVHPVAEYTISGLPNRIELNKGCALGNETFKNYQVLIDCANKRLVLGKYE